MMNNHVSQEHLDTAVSVSPSGTETLVQTLPALSSTIPQPSNSLTTPELAATSSTASAVPVVTSSPSAALTTQIPATPLTSVEEDLVAAAPKALPEDLAMGKQNANIFAPEPTDLDAMFGKRGYIEPSDLIPKVQDAELYGGFKPDPNLNQNFLQNRWSMGIDTSTNSRNFVNDLRGVPYPPQMASFPWQNPTQFPDLYRKSFDEVR
jgi:hypothetical protein